jgi:hypothetical protein
MKAQWYVCESHARGIEGFCLYTERSAGKMEERLGLARCIKHGALLFHDGRLDGMPRAQARARIEQEEAEARSRTRE